MAIEVVKRGTALSEKVYTVHCTGCRSKLRFKRADADYISDQRDGDCLKVNCPVCQRSVYTSL